MGQALQSAATARAFEGDLEQALGRISIPSYVIDATGVVRWLNPAAEEIVGDVRGRQFTSIVAPEDIRRSREVFARKVVGTVEVTDVELCVFDHTGERRLIELSSVPLVSGHRVIGVFGQVIRQVSAPVLPHPALTPRQAEILRLLEHGWSTRHIAAELHISVDTVRNHIRRLLRALGVHSRLEAVALARQEHLV